jgi:hypothetical protein
MVGQIDRLFAGAGYVEYRRILRGVVSREVGSRGKFVTRSLDAPLNARDLGDNDVVHTRYARLVRASPARSSLRSSLSFP